jgi:hypothetical protein
MTDAGSLGPSLDNAGVEERCPVRGYAGMGEEEPCWNGPGDGAAVRRPPPNGDFDRLWWDGAGWSDGDCERLDGRALPPPPCWRDPYRAFMLDTLTMGGSMYPSASSFFSSSSKDDAL